MATKERRKTPPGAPAYHRLTEEERIIIEIGLYPFFSLLKIQPSGTAFAPAKSHTFKRRELYHKRSTKSKRKV